MKIPGGSELSRWLAVALFFLLLIPSFTSEAQVSAVQARHETDDQNSVTITLNPALGPSGYNTTAGWSVTVGGNPVAISSVFASANSSLVTITWPVGQAIGIGQAVVINFTGDAAINPIVNLASQNNRPIECTDFAWQATNTPSGVCAPVTPQEKMVFSVKRGARNSSQYSNAIYRGRIDWGQGTVTNVEEYESDAAGSPAANTYFITIDATISGFSYPANENVCGYVSNWRIRFNTGFCPLFNANQTVVYNSYNTDAAGEGDGALNLPPSVAGTDLVCLGSNVNMTFSDNTNRNCAPDPDGAGPLNINDGNRWVRVRYGFPDAGAGQNIPNVFVGGQQVTDASGNLLPAFAADGYIPLVPNALGTPDGIGVVLFPASQALDANRVLELITTSSPAGQAVGQVFNVTMEYWNQCNAYSFPITNNARTITNEVVIIERPDPPVVADRDICASGESLQLSVNPTVPGVTYRWYRTLTDAQNQTNVAQTGANYTPTSGQAPAGQTTQFFVRGTLGNGCVSEITTVNLTRRSALSTAGLSIQGPGDLCPNSSYVFQVNAPPAVGSPGGLPTRYRWQVPAGWSVSDGGIGQSVTITTDGNTGGRTITVNYEYENVTSNTTRCGVTFTRNVTVRARPTASILPDPANLCEGSTLQLNGNPTIPFGTVESHLWTGSVGILDNATIQQPTVQNTATNGSYNLTYTITANFGNGVLCSNSDNITVNVSANPTLSSAGTDQLLCQVSLTSNPIGASNPAPGTGTWTVQSRPSGSNVIFNSGVNAPNTTITVDQNGAYVLRWTVVNGACTSFDDVLIDFGTDPGPQDAGSNNSFCGLSGSLNAVAPTVGNIQWSQSGGPGTTTFSNQNIPNPTLTVTQFGTYTYTYTVTSGNCAPRTDDVTITFNPPATSTPMADFTSCVDENTLAPIALTGTVGGGATGGRWERVTAGAGLGTLQSSGTATGGTIAGVTINDAYVPTANDFSNGSVQLRLVASGATAPCTEISTTITITFDRLPTVINAGADQPLVCADPITGLGSTTLNASAPNHGGTGQWSGPGGVTFGNSTSPTSTVSNLPVGTTTLTWTVFSALDGTPGACASQTATVDITVNALPAANNPAPSNLCESNEGTGIALGADITQYHDGITGIVGSTDRTIQWFTNPARTVASLIVTPTSVNVSNGATLYTRVTNTITNCFRDGEVTFTVNPLPAAIDQQFDFCEVFPAGSNQVNDINLADNAIISPITGGAANRTVTWFTTQAGAINNTPADLISTPAAFDIIGNTTVFARVVNTLTSCVNIAEVDLLVKPRPADPTIFGSANQCVGNFDLYNITPVGGATYIWDVDDNPATEFDVISGGGANDFLVVVSFPNVYTGNIRVTVDLDGCTSNQVSRSVVVDATPPAVTIVASKDPVCEDENGVVYTATALPNTDYTWTVPGTTGAIIGGQGTNQVTVNIGSVSGNIQVTPQTQGGSCAGSPATYFIDVRERPVLSTTLNATVCSDTPIGVVLSEAGGSVPAAAYRITNVTVPPGLSPSSRPVTNPVTATEIQNDVYTNTTGGDLTVRYTVVPVSAEGCEGSPVDVFVTIQPEPTLNPNLGKAICSREQTGIILSVATGSVPADQFEIVSINANGLTAGGGNPQIGGGIFGPSEIADDAWINTTGAPVVVTYNVRPINSGTGCIGDPPLAVLVTVNPEPVVSVFAETICSGSIPTTTLTTTNLPGSSFSWTVKSISGTILGATNGTGNTLNNQLINNSEVSGSVTYEVISTGPAGSGSCIGQPQDVVITVDPAPSGNDITETVCSDVAGGNTITRDLLALEPSVNNTGTVTFTWYRDLAQTDQITGGDLSTYVITSGIPVYALVDNGQCTKLVTVTYTINPLPAITSTAPQFNGFEINCNGAGNGQINASANSGTGPYIFSINGGATYFPSGTFNALVPGVYTIRVRDSRGCEVDSSPITIAEPAPVVASPGTVTDVLCRGSATGSIEVIGNGGVGGYTYSLNGGAFQASPIFNSLAAGTYTIAVRDANGCIDTEFVTINEPTAVAGAIDSQTNVDCNGNATGAVTVSGSGGVGGYEFSLNGGAFQASGTFTNLSAATYTVTVRDANLCTANVQVIITQPAILALTLDSKDDVDCNGGNDGSIVVTGSGGTAPYEYAINGGAFQPSGTFTGLTQGNYIVTVRDDQNCETFINVTINQPALLVGSITNQTNVNCFGNSTGSVTVNGSGGTGTYQFSLDGVAFQGSGTFSGLAAGSYIVTVRDQNNCTATVPVTITEPTLLSGNVDNLTDALCNGGASGTVTISGSGGVGPYTFSINGGGLFVASGTFTGLTAGNYTVIVRDNNLCTTNVPFVINEPAALTASSLTVTNVDCRGNNTGSLEVSATGGTLPYEYSINGGAFQPSSVFTGLMAGSYTIRVRDTNLCTFDYNQTITEPTQLLLNLVTQTNVDCNGNSTGSVTVAGAGGTIGAGYTYSLVNAGDPPGAFGASPTFSGLVAGNYTIYVQDANACQNQRDIEITEPQVLLLNLISKVDVICNGQNTGSINVQAAQGTSPYEYSINGSPFTPNNTFTFLAAGDYTIVAQDFNGCQETILVNIAQPNALTGSSAATSDYNGFDVSCFNDNDGQLTVTAVGGVGPYTYLLLQDPSNNTGTNSGVFENVRAGNYSVRITDANSCSFITAIIPVTQPNDINVQIGKTVSYNGFDVSCLGATDGEISVTSITGGAGGYSYILNPAANTSGDVSGIYTGLGSGVYTITVNDANGCSKQSLPVVLIDPLPLFEGIIAFDEAICIGEDPVALQEIAPAFGGIGNYTYQWQESTDNVTFTDILGANGSTFDPPAIGDTRFYRRVVTSGSCTSLESNVVRVTVNPLPTGTFNPSKSPVCQGDFFLLNFEFTGTAPFTFNYSDGTNTISRIGVESTPVPVINYQNETTYTLVDVRDFNGCSITVNQAITVPIISIDNSFTIVGPDAQCAGSEFEFQWEVDPDVQYTWFFGGDQIVIGPNDPAYPPGVNTISQIRNEISTSGTLTIPIILQAESTILAGCTPLPASDEIYVFPSVVENVIPGDTVICHDQEVQFRNNSIGASNHLWEYRIKGSGDTPTQLTSQNVTIQFPNLTSVNPLIYEVNYRGSNLNNCFAEESFDVVVYKGVTPNFTFDPTNPVFTGGTSLVSFTNTSSVIDDGIFRYDWAFGSNATPGSQVGEGPFDVSYASPGFKTVTLTVTNIQAELDGEACAVTRTQLIEILVPPFNAAFTVTPLNSCYPTELVTDNLSGAADTFFWWLIDAKNDTVAVSNLNEPTFKIFGSGVYRVVLEATVAATNQSEKEIVSDIRVFDRPIASFVAFPTQGFTDTQISFADQSVSAIDPVTGVVYPLNYYWDFGDQSPIVTEQNPVHVFDFEDVYVIELKVSNIHSIDPNDPTLTLECSDSTTRQVVIKQGGNIKIPNAFTPNTRGPISGNPADNPFERNDIFLPIMKGVEEFEMQVFDRWGNLIFESKDKNIGWNGYDRSGNLLPAGVYVYKLVLRLADGQRTTQVGDITLIR